MSPTPLHLLLVLGPLGASFVWFLCRMVQREERRHLKEIIVRITVDISGFTEAMQRFNQSIAALGVSAEQASANIRAAAQRHPELWGLAFAGIGDGDPVPQIGDDELQAWRDFISETKQRSVVAQPRERFGHGSKSDIFEAKVDQ